MNLRKRLLLTNLSLLVIPPVLALVLSLAVFLPLASLWGTPVSFSEVEGALRMRASLFAAAAAIWRESPETAAREEFAWYVASSLGDLPAQVLVEKDGNQVAATGPLRMADLLDLGIGDPLLSTRTVTLKGTRYVLQSQRLAFGDGATGAVHLLVETGPETETAFAFAVFALGTLFLSALLTSVLYSIRIHRSLASPLVRLNDAVSELRQGRLDREMLEEGDEEIRQVIRSLEALRLKLQESVDGRERVDESRKRLVESLSHDLKTPVTSIRGYVEGLLDGIADTPEKRRKYLETIRTKAEGLDRMLDDLVFFSRLELEQVPYDFQPTEPEVYLAACIEENREDFARDGMVFSLENQLSGHPRVCIDRDRMKRVFQNLFENARKYRKGDSGSIDVVLRDTPDRVLLEVRDSGIGIPPDSLPHIFDRFYRADASRSRADGSGLGLSIARQIVEDHRGALWVRSREGEGATFVVSLPKEPEDA